MGKQLDRFFISFLLLIPLIGFAQIKQNAITGKVVTEKGDALTGATVSLVNESNKKIMITYSDEIGIFSFKAIPMNLNYTIIFSYVGYQTDSITHFSITRESENNSIVMRLKSIETKSSLEEVVVVGYGTQKASQISGAISTVKIKDIMSDRPVSSISELLVNVLPGLNTTVGSGQPGTSVKVNVRGATNINTIGNSINTGTPLMVVDNIPTTRALTMLNPSDIESVTLLKDAASAAIYGGQAAFGVLLITTKHGTKNQNPQFSYSNNITLTSPTNLPVKANAKQFLQSLTDMGTTGYWSGQNVATWTALYDTTKNPVATYGPGGVARINGVLYPLVPQDVMKDLLGNNVPQFQQNFSVSGGSDKTTYRLSFGNTNETGVILPHSKVDFYKRYTVSSFLSSGVTSWLTTQLSVNYAKQNSSTPNYNGFSNGILFPVLIPTSDSLLPGTGQIGINGTPANLTRLGGNNTSNNSMTRALGRLILNPFTGMTVTGEYAYDYLAINQANYSSLIPYVVSSAAGTTGAIGGDSYQLTDSTSINKMLNIYANYHRALGDHNITLMVGYNQQENTGTSFTAQRTGMTAASQPSLTNATGATLASNRYAAGNVQGYFGRLNYNYNEKYFLQLGGRYDGSSNFPKRHRFGFFPSVSASWIISKEHFMEKLTTLSFLKLRVDYGSVGNQAVTAYQYLPVMASSTPYWLAGSSSYLSSLSAPILPGSDFTWETASSIDFGTDFGLFSDHLTGTFDWYQRDTKNMLASGAQPLPAVVGAVAPLQNTANLRVRGFEIQLNYNTTIGKDVRIRVGANLANNSGVITKYLGNPNKLLSTYYTGQKLGEIWGYVTDGFYTTDDFVTGTLNSNLTGGTLKPGIPTYQGELPNPGDVRFKDLDQDGKIFTGLNTVDSAGDRRIIGNNNPRYMYGLNGAITYKNITFSFVLSGVGKQELAGSGILIFPNSNAFGTIYANELNYWTPTNSNAYYGRIYNQGAGNQSYNQMVQTRYLQNGAYLRISNLGLNYAIPKNLIKPLFMKSFNVFISMENPFLFSHLPKGLDPQLYTANGSGFTYPFLKKTSFGVNVTF